MRISAAIAAVVLVLVVIVVPQDLGAQLGPRISLYSSDRDLSGVPGSLLTSSDNITASPVRNLPDSVHPGDTFNVTVNFTSPEDNFSVVDLIDHAPSGWTVTVQPGWCSPAANWVGVTNNATDNCVEIFWWLDTYPQGTNFTVRYEVTVPGNASSGNYNFSGTLDFACDPDNTPVTEPIGGDGTIAVYLSGSPQLSFTPTALSFHGVEGGPNPLDAILRIWNSGGEVLNWSVNCSAPWLSMNPTSGSSTGEIDRVNVSVNTSGMGEGQNQTNITITPEGANATLIPVSLTIIPPSSPMRNLPLQVYPGGTFDVGVNWTLNPTLTKNVSGIALVDNTSVTNATGAKFYWGDPNPPLQINETPAATTNKTVRGGGNTSVEYQWNANYTPGETFSVRYRVTVPINTPPGIYNMTVCPDNSTAWLEYYVGEDAYVECIGGDWQVEVLSPPPVRNLPPEVHCGETFEVIVNWSYPVDNRNAIGFTDLAPAGLNVTVNESWCTPQANFSNLVGNKIEYAWDDIYNASTDFTIRYKVTVPANTTQGNYTFPCNDCSQSWLEYYVGEGGPYKSCTVGDCEVNVTGFNLTVTSDGCCPIDVSGAVIDTIPAGGNATYPDLACGANVTLNATSTGNCNFSNWTVDGNVTTNNPINVTMDSDYTAVANCTVTGVGPGPGGGGGAAPPPPPPAVCCPCDVNCDGFYNALDVSEEHRIVLLLDAPTAGADCTQDGVIDARDVTGVKRAILWICCGPCDPNCDGFIDARDVTKMHRIIAGIDDATPGADCNADGKVDARDLTAIKQIVVEVQKQPQPVIVPPCRCYK